VSGTAVDLGGDTLAAIDTGTSLLIGPAAAVTAIWAAVPNSVPLTGDMAGSFSYRAYYVTFDGAKLHTAGLTRRTLAF
jgi:hypothetical protein